MYHIKLDRLPYQLTDYEKDEMRRVFSVVMKPLAFSAKENFVENLFNTDILIRIFSDSDKRLVGFGNVKIRESAGIRVRHVFTIYVSPAHRGHNLSVRAVAKALRSEAVRNMLCIFKPLYVTGSSANPMTVLSLARRTTVWPDLLRGTPPPPEVERIASDTAQRFYPKVGDKPFQVLITPEFANVRDDGDVQKTDNENFNQRFYEIADPNELKLLLFVAKITFRDIASSFVEEIRQSLSSPRQARARAAS
ncbi:MAG: GNAT family N-acetyltransferase [Pyrinomonadaceae bacterium]